MNLFEKVFGNKNVVVETGESEPPKIDETITLVESSDDFKMAINAGELSGAEAYLMSEKEKPSQSGHDDSWLQNKLIILLSQYVAHKDTAGVERINQLLPANFQRQIKEDN
jgi:hypothetical protein